MQRIKNRKIRRARNTAVILLIILAIMAVPTIILETLCQQTHSKAQGPPRLTPYNDAPELLKGE